MSLLCGIVGLPNVGKSTLFNALLSRRQAPVGSHPFTTVKPNTGVVRVPDTRLSKLSKLIKPEKTSAATITFVDIAGLVRGAHKGEGLGNEFLSHIRGVDILCHVVREFDDRKVAHIMGSVEPLRDRDIVITELALKDLEILERASAVRGIDSLTKTTLEKLIGALNADKPLLSVTLSKEERESISHIQLLSNKPSFYVLNSAERDLEVLKAELKKISGSLDDGIVVCAKLEEEFIDLEEKEQASFRRQLGLRGSGLDKVITKAYSLLQLITFYTVKGAGREGHVSKGEVRAWSIQRGSTALQAASLVHTDFSKNFVTAEVCDVETLLKYSGWKQAREQGKVRTEGREYVIRDGDTIEIKASP
jgi:ribosome-binding ATPase